jgi:hypothetical protein
MRIQAQADQHGLVRRAYNYEPFEMPTEAVWHYRKFDVYEEGESRMQTELAEDIARSGVQTPLSIALGSDHRQALIQDGNHRVAAARRVGRPTVPVWIDTWDEGDLAYLSSLGAKDLEPWLRQWVEANL